MASSRLRPALLALAAFAVLSGCAQWQQDPDGFASVLDDPMLARAAEVLGERRAPRPAPIAIESPTVVQTAQQTTPSPATLPAPIPKPSDGPTERPEEAAAQNAAAPRDDSEKAATPACCESLGQPRAALCSLENACGRCPACLAVRDCKLFQRPDPGPPPISYRPAMPPKFLPVPTQPTLSPARPDAPDPWRGDVELGWRSQVTLPGRD